MPGYGTPADPRVEFEALGPAGVRKVIAARRWDAETTTAARLWLQAQDAKVWQEVNADRPAGAMSFTMRLRSLPWIKYVLPIAGAVVALAFMLPKLRM